MIKIKTCRSTGMATVFAIATVLAMPTFARATTWDLATDFSITNGNPNGAWRYGWEPAGAVNGALTLYNATFPGRWYDSSHTSGDITPTIFLTAPGHVALHPGWDNSFSVARWTSTLTGQVQVNGAFGAGDIGHESYYISVDGATAYSWLSDSGTETFSFSRHVVAGDTIDFIVGVPIGGNYVYGTTPLDANISGVGVSAVPEPSTWVMLLAGFAGLGVAVHRRRGGVAFAQAA